MSLQKKTKRPTKNNLFQIFTLFNIVQLILITRIKNWKIYPLTRLDAAWVRRRRLPHTSFQRYILYYSPLPGGRDGGNENILFSICIYKNWGKKLFLRKERGGGTIFIIYNIYPCILWSSWLPTGLTHLIKIQIRNATRKFFTIRRFDGGYKIYLNDFFVQYDCKYFGRRETGCVMRHIWMKF